MRVFDTPKASRGCEWGREITKESEDK